MFQFNFIDKFITKSFSFTSIFLIRLQTSFDKLIHLMLTVAILAAHLIAHSDFLLPSVARWLQLIKKKIKTLIKKYVNAPSAMINISIISPKQNKLINYTYIEWQQIALQYIKILRNGEQCMNNIFNANDAMLAEMIFNQLI